MSIHTINLAGAWDLGWTEGMHGTEGQHLEAQLDRARTLQVRLPGEFHSVLRKAGWLDDPNLGLNSLKQRWVEEQMWFCRRTFQVPPALARSAARLVLEQVDLDAEIVLNGQVLGRHANAHRPCVLDAGGKLKSGLNEISIRIESGLFAVSGKGNQYSGSLDQRLNKRPWMRKAQYQCGWDWSPRLLNVGLGGVMRLEFGALKLEQVSVTAVPDAGLGSAEVKARVFVANAGPASRARIGMVCGKARTSVDVPAPRGNSVHEVSLRLINPELWWPRGQGKQALHKVIMKLSDASDRSDWSDMREVKVGIRKIALLQPAHPAGGKYFIVEVNNRPVFCKGGNWVPPDLIPAEVEAGRLRRLVDLACESNFNLLRIWGGGNYAGHELLDLCDEKGILVWHDMPFACSTYPADDAAFMKEVQKELRWAVREFASHPSLAVWCGNNELDQGYNWSYHRGSTWGEWDKTLVDHGLFHLAIPMLMAEEDPTRPFWPTSPYSGAGHLDSRDELQGDQHPWDVSLGQAGPDFRAYRSRVDRFPNEGGVLGASTPATLKQALGKQFKFRSPAWEHHDNAVQFWGSGPGVCYRAMPFWLGRDAQAMKLEDYLFASSLLQAEGLSEYVANYRRRMFSSASAIYWMFNDSWPATHGWTTVDYYLRKKLAFHPVRRAMAAVSVVVAEEKGIVKVFGVNDSPEPWSGSLEAGLFRLTGGLAGRVDDPEVTLAPNASTVLAEISMAAWKRLGFKKAGAYARLIKDGLTVAQHRLFLEKFKDLVWPRSRTQTQISLKNGRAAFLSKSFVWALTLDLDGETKVPDNAFDLIPGLPYVMDWPRAGGNPKLLKTGNDLFA